MRISEKSIELNFCSGLSRSRFRPLFWFGLTQKQEARAGFDVAARLGARLVLFQIKASNHVMSRSGARRFRASHSQLRALQDRVGRSRSIYYVFPAFGSTGDLPTLRDPLASMWLLDVADLPTPMPPPTKSAGGLRKSGIHYVDLTPPVATIHSDPVEVYLQNAAEYASLALRDGVGFAADDAVGKFSSEVDLAVSEYFTGSAVGVALL